MGIFFFKAIPKYAIWGGKACNAYFDFTDEFDDGVGQVWAFSAQAGESTTCLTPPYEGLTLLEIWQEHPELFAYPAGPFPVIVSLVAPEEDLSIQVHPDMDKARELGYPMGKNEAWYFIRCRPQCSIVYGQHAQNEEEILRFIRHNRWNELVKTRPVAEGDFVYIPAGQLHALGKGSIVYEVQQSTDITYRFYDYGRKDAVGNTRPLHLQEAISCLDYSTSKKENTAPVRRKKGHYTETTFIRNDSFTVSSLEVAGKCSYDTIPYRLATVVEGSGYADGYAVRPGSSFLIPANQEVLFGGSMTVMMTTKELRGEGNE
ncbi:MAG: manA 2 [Paenibacillaceae bacterium]|jgi:mannose-6-phosphate isomerase|nr:manA 2 [Paenibacillaceae bacterium]